ncbi:ABC transporter, integral membrane type 1 [Penicillium occitanis (nom. inval.)]|nr:ABC transporter, integral membrane type 1 [Penicillium occitanis (nom. inval.)]PCG96003.1 hypothetical protein PENOC_074960 [Penicillium occitanis (nom. inval.)]
MADTSLCPLGSDDTFGPRVNPNCRAFDFTILFQDAFFSVLPTSLFLIVVLPRLQFLRRASVKLMSYSLVVWKLYIPKSLLILIFTLQVVFTAFQTTTPAIYTKLSLTSGLLNIVATFAAAVLSFAEDQRTVRPSDVLVVYFSAASIFHIPRLRTLWLIPSITTCKILWTAIYGFTVAILLAESARKTKLLRQLYQGLEDMPEIDDNLAGQAAEDKLQSAWNIINADRRQRLLYATFRAYGWVFLSGIPPRLALTALTFAQPFLITALVDWMGTDDAPADYGPALTGAVVLVYSSLAVLRAIYWRQTYRFITTIRAGLVSIIYTATTGLKSAQIKDMAAITLMDTDVERIASDFKYIHEVWASALEVGIALWLLERQVSVACLIPAVICLVSVLATIPVSRKSVNAQRKWIERIQKRLAATSHILGDVKAAKMLGLVNVVFAVVSKLREIEIKTSERFRKLLLWQISLSNIPTDFAPFATFTTYTVISVVRADDSLNLAQAFTSLSLIFLLTSPLLTFCQAFPSIVQTITCFRRIHRYILDSHALTDLEMSAEGFSGGTTELQEYDQSTASFSAPLVSFINADISWSTDTQVVLHNLNMNITQGITVLIGPVGSGKSTVLESILGQTYVKRGSLNSTLTKVAYCCQTPWIIDGTIQDNITGGAEFDDSWYQFTISACGLEEDMRAFTKNNTAKRTGNKGALLSGGQKQRVALARAVYSKNQVLVLDDVFSGLDSRIINNVIVLDEGRIVDHGPYTEILERRPDIIAESAMPVQKFLLPPPVDEPLASEKADETQVLVSDADSIHSNATSIAQKGGTWSVYGYYYHSAGLLPVVLLAVFSGLEAFGSNFATVWLQWWTEANSQQPNKELWKYLGVYTLLFGLSLLGIVAGCWVFLVKIITTTGLSLHRDLLQTTLASPFSFFRKISIGSIMNRFSQDIQLVDMELPMNGAQFVTVLDLIVGAITVVIVATMTSMRDQFAAGSIGVALNLVLTLNQSLGQMIKSWTSLEMSIGAVSRIRDFVRDTPSESDILVTPSRILPEWPSHGVIDFISVSARYSSTTVPVIQNLSLQIRAGEKVAICGPSGSGKTSLILALLQMIDVQQGRIEIDGVDLSTVPRNMLRKRLNTIPSDPFFMPGTVRFNLDPHGDATDESIELAIKKVGLWKRVSSEGGLDAEFSASKWSIGERQLLALARALNVCSRVLILDEATSSVDWRTEAIMQDIMDTEFASSQTVIAILHRLRHIDRFDRIVLLKRGQIVECDSPRALLERNSEFRKLFMSLESSET